jgi:hypothetical protein
VLISTRFSSEFCGLFVELSSSILKNPCKDLLGKETSAKSKTVIISLDYFVILWLKKIKTY